VVVLGVVRRAGVRLGAARLGRALHAVVARVLRSLLDDVQPPVCGQLRRTPARAADPLPELDGTRRRHGGRRRDVHRSPTGAPQSRRREAAAGQRGADARASPGRREADRGDDPRGEADDRRRAAAGSALLPDPADAGFARSERRGAAGAGGTTRNDVGWRSRGPVGGCEARRPGGCDERASRPGRPSGRDVGGRRTAADQRAAGRRQAGFGSRRARGASCAERGIALALAIRRSLAASGSSSAGHLGRAVRAVATIRAAVHCTVVRAGAEVRCAVVRRHANVPVAVGCAVAATDAASCTAAARHAEVVGAARCDRTGAVARRTGRRTCAAVREGWIVRCRQAGTARQRREAGRGSVAPRASMARRGRRNGLRGCRYDWMRT